MLSRGKLQRELNDILQYKRIFDFGFSCRQCFALIYAMPFHLFAYWNCFSNVLPLLPLTCIRVNLFKPSPPSSVRKRNEVANNSCPELDNLKEYFVRSV